MTNYKTELKPEDETEFCHETVNLVLDSDFSCLGRLWGNTASTGGDFTCIDGEKVAQFYYSIFIILTPTSTKFSHFTLRNGVRHGKTY